MDRYKNSIIKKDINNVSYRAVTNYPKITPKNTDILHTAVDGDRWDTLADRFYNDVSLWWIIARANIDYFKGNLQIPIASRLIIPTDIGDIVAELHRINRMAE
jgi:hypothetical protein